MNIHEHQAKEILKEFGAPVSNGVVITSIKEIPEKIKRLKSKQFVLKAQIHAGGRGKAGGVKLIKDISELEKEAKEIALKLSDNSSYPVYFFKTDTSGEKLFEEFYTSEDEVNFDLYQSIGVVTNSLKPSFSEMEVTIKEIENLFKRESYNKEDIIKIVNKNLSKKSRYNHLLRVALNSKLISISLRKRIPPKSNFNLKLVKLN